MRFIRQILGKIILFLDAVFAPRVRELTLDQRKKLETAADHFSLYQFEACPFCVKVRRFLKSEGIQMRLKDATAEPGRSELLRGGGALKVPCLRIDKANHSSEWMYESGDIIEYLKKNILV